MYYFYRYVPKRKKNRTKFDQNDEQMNNGLLPLDVRKSFACHGRASSAKAGKMRKFNRSQVLKKCQSLNISFQFTSQKKDTQAQIYTMTYCL